jgi:hypothetical protein
MAKAPNKISTNDEIRIAILEYLYNAWKNPRGMESHKLQISKITRGLKNKGIARKYVIRNLHYLIETGWVIEEVKKSQFFTGKMSVPTEKKTYRISKDGIDYFEESSIFQKPNKLAGINISNTKNSVIVLGDNNVVWNEHKELFENLEELGRQIRISSEISDNDKIEYQAEIDTIKAQLEKPKPNKDIVKKAWDALKAVATIGGVVGLYTKVQPLIETLLK